MPELIVYQGDQKFFCIPLDASHLSIGRSSKNDLILTGEQVSRHHAVIEQKGDGFWIKDHSTAGTAINGQRIDAPTKLADECEIGIANWRLTFKPSSAIQETENKRRQTQITELTKQAPSDTTKILQLEPGDLTFKLLKPHLIIHDSIKGERSFFVKKNRIVVGTDPNCDIKLHDEYVSKYHAEFRLSDHGFHVIDLDSTNGTFVNESKIKECYLKGNERIHFGSSSILITFEETTPVSIQPFSQNCFCGIYGQTLSMRLLFSKIRKVSETDMTVLIQGETGTGKEMVARAIHDLSNRRRKPYVVLNCGAISASLIESELFGHEKGAFTGATQRHLGAFEQANSGTLFLDEIGELPLDLQSKILRVLEYQSFKRLGGNQDIKVNVRIIAATHQDLVNMVARKEFREDLFYRLFVLNLPVPPLRTRKEDIDLLAKIFVDMGSADKSLYLDQSALEILKKHSWPGNVRELKNTMLRALAFCQKNYLSADDIEFVHIHKQDPSPDAVPDMPETNIIDNEENEAPFPKAKTNLEREEIIYALKVANGDKNMAARVLGIGRSTLFRKIKDLNLDTDKDNSS